MNMKYQIIAKAFMNEPFKNRTYRRMDLGHASNNLDDVEKDLKKQGYNITESTIGAMFSWLNGYKDGCPVCVECLNTEKYKRNTIPTYCNIPTYMQHAEEMDKANN